MAKPLDIDIRVTLQSEGYVQFRVHIDELDDVAAEDQQFILDVLDRMAKFAPPDAGTLFSLPLRPFGSSDELSH